MLTGIFGHPGHPPAIHWQGKDVPFFAKAAPIAGKFILRWPHPQSLRSLASRS